MSLRALAVGALVWQLASPAHAQLDVVVAEEDRYATDLLPADLYAAGWGADAEYEGGVIVAPSDPEVSPIVSFDIEAIRDLPLDLRRIDDPAMLHFLEFYATEGRRRAAGWIARSGRYRDMILAELDAADAPRELLWVVAVESAFDPFVVSNVGARGLWQFMDHTAREHGLRIDEWVDERLDPVAATRAAIDKLTGEHERFGTWPLALAAYNAGHGHVRGELRRDGVSDFWEMEDHGTLYGGARRYALRVFTLAIVSDNPTVFGVEGVVFDAPWTYDEVEVPGNVRLTLLAEAAGTSVDELRALNPALIAQRTPPDVERWVLRVPAGGRDAFVEAYDRLERRYGSEHEEVRLRFGETLDDLATRFGISVRVLRAINGVDRSAPSPYDATILVPLRGRDPGEVASATPRVLVVPSTRFAYAERRRVFYEVNAGDTQAVVAAAFGCEVYQLAAWNDLDPRARLQAGQTLQLWVPHEIDLSEVVYLDEETVTAVALGSPEWLAWQAEAESASASRRRTYTVRSGDTVSGIAGRFGVRAADIVRWNDLGGDAMIVVGESLVVGR